MIHIIENKYNNIFMFNIINKIKKIFNIIFKVL